MKLILSYSHICRFWKNVNRCDIYYAKKIDRKRVIIFYQEKATPFLPPKYRQLNYVEKIHQKTLYSGINILPLKITQKSGDILTSENYGKLKTKRIFFFSSTIFRKRSDLSILKRITLFITKVLKNRKKWVINSVKNDNLFSQLKICVIQIWSRETFPSFSSLIWDIRKSKRW